MRDSGDSAYLQPRVHCATCGCITRGHKADLAGPRHIHCLRDQYGRLLIGPRLPLSPEISERLMGRARLLRERVAA